MSEWEWIMSSIIILVSACLQSVTGFGFALISIPLLSLYFDPHWVIPLVTSASFATLFMNMRTAWSETDRALLKKLLIGSVCGLPLGGVLFYFMDAQTLRIIVSVIICGFTLLIVVQSYISPWLQKVTNHEWIFGVASGMLTSSVGLSGPPIMMLLAAKNKNQSHFRGTGISYLFFVCPASVLILLLSGAPVGEIWKPLLVFIPFVYIGRMIGDRLYAHLPPKYFRSLIYMILLATGIYSFYENL